MEGILWSFHTADGGVAAWPLFWSLVVCLGVFQVDFLLLIVSSLGRAALGRGDGFRPAGPGERPSALVIIPSLLRNDDDLRAITTTVASCATNGYPGDLVVIASVDGRTEHPVHFATLVAWVREQRFPSNVRVFVAGTETRLGKMMAVDAGLEHMRRLCESGRHPAFPDLYFSVDGDGTLGPHALERLACRLTTPHPLTKNPRRVVSGKICIHPELAWSGWRALLTVKGYLYAQVAREFLVSNVARHNWKPTPKIGIPGALYCTWSTLILDAPRYMGFMQTLRFRDWVKWWFGACPPRFSESAAPPLPEALTGASDDTCIAFLASMATWKDGKLDLDAPRTPLHALGRLFVAYFVERSHDYEPEARVFTDTPTTFRALWTQRVRWNSSRFECAGRFWRGFWFHWEIGLPVGAHLWLVLQTVVEMTTYYVLLPCFVLGASNVLVAYLLGYATQTLAYSAYTVMALALDRDRRRSWPVLVSLPLAAFHAITINFFGCAYGVSRDLFLFGNSTSFAPEWTLKKGCCERVALLFRVRRFFALALRSVLYGDVPLGLFWLGWQETQWTPSGFDGWTTGEKPRPIVPWPRLAAACVERTDAAPRDSREGAA